MIYTNVGAVANLRPLLNGLYAALLEIICNFQHVWKILTLKIGFHRVLQNFLALMNCFKLCDDEVKKFPLSLSPTYFLLFLLR